MFFHEKVHPREVVKWGIMAGFLQGLYIGIATLFYAEREGIFSILSGWEHGIIMLLFSFIVISAIITSIIVFAHPIYSITQKRYNEAILTILVTIITLAAITGFVIFAYQNLFLNQTI